MPRVVLLIPSPHPTHPPSRFSVALCPQVAREAQSKMENMLEMFDADSTDMVNSVDDLVGRASPSSDISGGKTSPSPQTVKNSPVAQKAKKRRSDLPAIDWDKLFMTGTLNVDDHIEKLNAAKERRKKLMDFATKEGKGAGKGSVATKPKKDPFKAYSARRTSVNPVDGLQYIDKLLIEVRTAGLFLVVYSQNPT